ncbi:MAG: DUF11 domain-containing protein [Methanobacteriota archaeon]|nr:MAG: DUF11 domain-containing protein [Euryarchaeota archaeon]
MERYRVPAPGEAFVRYRSTILSLLIVSPLLACLFIGSLPARATQLAIFESVEPPFVEGPYLFKNQDLAQSFTATMNYELIRVQAMVHDLDPTQPVDPLDLSIETNSAGVPSGTVLATSRADGDFGYNWLMFDLTAPVNVTAGQTYWIVLEDNNGMSQQSGYKWAVKGADTYPRGVYAIRSGGGGWVPSAADDLLFRTWGIDGPQIAAGITVDSSTAGVWDPLTYTMCFNNTGTRAATYVWANVSLSPNTTYLSDTAAAVGGTALGPLSWQFTDVAVGAHNFHVDVRVNPGIFDGLPILAALRIDYANQTEALQERTNASVTVIARAPSLAVTKTVTPRFLAPGDNVTYTIGVVNSGSRPSPWVWVNDSLPPEVTYVSDTAAILANFTSKSFDGIVLHVLLTDLPQGSYAFDILARAEFGLRNGTAFTNTVNVDFADRRGVRVVPSPTAFATARIGGASILVAKTANVTSAPPGGEVRYRVRYDNRGNASARTLWINDSLPAEVDYVSDSGGGSYSTGVVRFVFQNVSVGLHSLTITARIRNGTTDGTIVQNIATLAYSDWDGSPGPGSSSYVDVLAAQPVVSVRLSGPTVANPGDHQNVVVRIANWGNGTAGAVWVNLSLPSTVVRESDNASVFGGTATP